MTNIYCAPIPRFAFFRKPTPVVVNMPRLRPIQPETPRDLAWLAQRLPIFAKMVADVQATKRNEQKYRDRYQAGHQ